MVYPLTTKTIVKQVEVRQDKVFRYTAVIRDQAGSISFASLKIQKLH